MADNNPYLKVWNEADEYESELQKDVNNGVLFEPSYEVMAQRHEASCRHYLRVARKLGRTVEGLEAFNEALFHWRMAERMYAKRDEVLAKSR